MEFEKLRSNIELPDCYYITYNVEKEKGIIKQLTQARDQKGNIYFDNGENKQLFVKTAKGYRSYFIEETGIWVLENNQYYSERHIKESCKKFYDCIEKAVLQRIGKVELQGKNILVGRECDVFHVKIKIAVFSQSFLCAVDVESGICLRWKQESNLNGFVVEGTGNFECSEFTTANIDERMPKQSL